MSLTVTGSGIKEDSHRAVRYLHGAWLGLASLTTPQHWRLERGNWELMILERLQEGGGGGGDFLI